MNGLSLRGMKLRALGLIACTAFFTSALRAQQSAVFQIEFTNLQLVPSHWTLKLSPDGSGQFDAEGGQPTQEEAKTILAGDVHRPVQLSPAFTEQVFSTARTRRWFAFPCESHMKVAFQGTKRLSYSGPEGSGACEYNYSKDKQIEELGNSLMAVEFTILSGARMEKLLQHDRLGLDEELDNLVTALHEGSAAEVGTIRETLTRIASDEEVMDRVRRKARQLLTQIR
ncbi:hypothetical protein [Acidicapsa acidisoli]|uniref:hypothetical protein n=1 Tax=Acidicapsa acidisoli TaxID=1615681 RepID=UPI0021DF938C|nr:hypothetical protein [Acidicapsa acidisoli]